MTDVYFLQYVFISKFSASAVNSYGKSVMTTNVSKFSSFLTLFIGLHYKYTKVCACVCINFPY